MPSLAARSRSRSAVRALAPVVLVVGSLGVVGCSRSTFHDRTARLTRGGVVTEFDLDSCGRDGVTVFVVGRTEGGRILQAVVGLRKDRRTGVTDLTGVSVTDRAEAEEAGFGAGAWRRRGGPPPAPGQVFSARVRGSRVQVSGTLEPVAGDAAGAASTTSAPADPEAGPAGDAAATPFTLDARCDR